MASVGEREVLLGILASRLGCVTARDLVDRLRSWSADKSRPLGELLVEQRLLSPERRDLLTRLVDVQLAEHQGAAREVVELLCLDSSVLNQLSQLADPDIRACLPVQQAGADDHGPETVIEATQLESHRQQGRFQVLRPHAEGGLGTVSVALDTELKREVAFKEVKRAFAKDANAQSRFVLEAEVTGGLEHPGIVPVYALGAFSDGRPYYAMRFIRGDSLHDAIKRFHEHRGRLVPASSSSPPALSPHGHDTDPNSSGSAIHAPNNVSKRKNSTRTPYVSDLEFRALINRLIDVCNAIEYAHSRGVLHRDLKPGNIMLGRYGETLVVDWGLAKVLGRDLHSSPESTQLGTADTERPLVPASDKLVTPTMMGKAIGTPAFMSPEQASGQLDDLGPATDIYSLGATLFQLMTGVPPIGARTEESSERLGLAELLQRARTGQFPKPSSINPETPRPLEAVCLKAMSLAAVDRYRSARALAVELERWLADEPVKAYPEVWTTRLRRAVRRHQTLAATSAALVFATLVGLGIMLVVVSASNERLAAESRRAFRNYYASQINLAQRDWEKADINHLEERLRQTEAASTGGEDLRGFEWHFWNQLRHRAELPLKGHTGDIKSVAVHPNGTRLATASGDATAKIWDLSTGRVLMTLAGHTGDVNDVAFNRQGTLVATVSEDGTARLWDALDGHLVRVFGGHTNFVVCLALSADGTQLATGGRDNAVRLWDVASGKEIAVLPGHTGWVRGLVFNQDGSRLASASADTTIKLWNTRTGSELATFKGHTKEVQGVAFSPDGKKLASASEDGTLKVWDAETATHQSTLTGHDGTVFGAVFVSDGRELASAGQDQLIKIWDVETGKEQATLSGHGGEVRSLVLASDGQRLISASWDQTVRTWDVANRKEVARLDCTLVGDGNLESTTLRAHRHWAVCVDFSLDGRYFASGSKDEFVKIWDAATNRELRTLKAHTSGVYEVAFSPDGQRLATCGCDQTVKVWQVESGELLLTLGGKLGWVYSTDFSPDGSQLASASADRTVRIWDSRDGRELLTLRGHTNEVNDVSFSPDGLRLATVSDDRTARVWDLTSGRELLVFEGHTGVLFGVAFSPDGRYVASAGQDETVRVWDSRTGVEHRVLRGHVDDVNRVTFSRDGRRLISTGDDHTIKLWDMLSGQELLTLKGHTAGVRDVAMNSDGSRIISASWDRTVKLWDARPSR